MMRKFIKFLLIGLGVLLVIGIIGVVVFLVTTTVMPESATLSSRRPAREKPCF
jgi:hypothetical protein